MKGCDRVQHRGLAGGVDSEEDAHACGEGERESDAAEHGEKGAEFMRPDAFQGDPYTFGDIHVT